MSASRVKQALVERAATVVGAPFSLPNEDAPNTLPRYIIQTGPNAQSTLTIGGCTTVDSEIIVLCEIEPGTYDKASDDMVDALVALFPVNLRLPTTDGVVTILSAPNPRPPMRTADAYTVPVVIRGRGYF